MTFFMAVLWLVMLTFLPMLELRASIPFGFFHAGIRSAISLPGMVLLCLVTNICVGVIAYRLMGPVERWLRLWGWFDRVIWPRIARARGKLHPYVEKYGEFGVALFIGVPLPGTGAYTGAFGSYLLGLDRRRFYIANALGVLLACCAVTAICLLIDQGVVAEDSLMRHIFLKQVPAAE